MKTLMRVSLIALLVSAAVVVQASPEDEITPIASKYKNLFVFKADKEFVGATVEIRYSNGDIVATQKLEKRKMIIDFCDTRYGAYTIRVVKGDKEQSFHYVKK